MDVRRLACASRVCFAPDRAPRPPEAHDANRLDSSSFYFATHLAILTRPHLAVAESEMAFLGAPLRWPDALPVAVDFDGLTSHIRPFLPRPLDTLPSPLIASAFVTWVLVTAITIFSALMNQRRMVLAPPHAEKAATRRSLKGGKPTALLLGPEQTGKSAIFSALSMKAVPETKTTQQENGCTVTLPAESTATTDEKTQSKNVLLWDLPGHPRLRAKADAFLPKADKLVFCVDATSAIRGGTSRNDNLVDAVE